ncbi:hypothetical protein PR048_009542 [Dryococelus australis]|uniref:Reverse transcriptase n=1 Tax=Dryococelus australis TaxID=614101 RepID=A0ABQ9I072_9NEOP|nr:hypothetical protein PR048_009542 [Dryococelus australis]
MKVLVKEIKDVGLEINIEKTKYLPITNGFKNWIIRQICDPVKEGDNRRRRKNRELKNLYQLLDIVAAKVVWPHHEKGWRSHKKCGRKMLRRKETIWET